MEERFSFNDKKRALALYIKSIQSKSYSVNEYSNIKLKTESENCLYCDNPSSGLYCSNICKLIFLSNNSYLEEKTHCICFPPFELIEDKEMFRELVKDNRQYSNMHINYSLEEDEFRGKFKFIENFDFVKIISPNFKLASSPSSVCLYCKEESPKFVINLKNNLLGVCSSFCLSVFKTRIEDHVNFPSKSFHDLPHISLLKDKSVILKLKEEDYPSVIYTVVKTGPDTVKINRTNY